MSSPTNEGEVVRAPTVVFDSDQLKANGLVHSVIAEDAVPSRQTTLVTTACGIKGIGVVKLRRGFNCTECKYAYKISREAILKNAESANGVPASS